MKIVGIGEIDPELAKNFLPVARCLREEGKSDREIHAAFRSYVQRRVDATYRANRDPKRIGLSIISMVEAWSGHGADRKIEHIYYERFIREGILFEFQKKEGPYRLDFLIHEVLDFEIDGPQHDPEKDAIRDRYMEERDIMVIRVPADEAASEIDTVIERLKFILKPYLDENL